MKGFEYVDIIHVPREYNVRAYMLSKLASTGTTNRNKIVIQEVLTEPSVQWHKTQMHVTWHFVHQPLFFLRVMLTCALTNLCHKGTIKGNKNKSCIENTTYVLNYKTLLRFPYTICCLWQHFFRGRVKIVP